MSRAKMVIQNVSQVVKSRKKPKTILTNVNLTINEGEFVAIVGCSGAGKTTLMNILSGYVKPSTGRILVDGLDLFKDEEYLKGRIAYVPQEEILDPTLTLYKSLEYSLSLRVKGITKKRSKEIINKTLRTLELYHVRNVLIKNLSGGEKKRASVATEMLSDPGLFLLDEPTSGLDSNIEKKVMLKLRDIADTGKTILITAHTVSNLHLCDKIIFMGRDGKICYYGKYEDVFNYFGVTEFVDIYDILKEDTNTWYKKYEQISNSVLEIETTSVDRKKLPRVGFFKQTGILVKRYVNSLWNNKFMLVLLFGQSVLMGLLICLAVKKDCFTDPRFSVMIGAAFTMAAMWLGLFNTIQEIVKERDMLKKEYMSGLRFSSYIISKIIVFSVLCLWQAFTCVSIVYFYLDPRPDDVLITNTWLDLMINFFIVTFTTSVNGLLISAIVKEARTTLIMSPLYIMVQMLFSGMFIPLVDLTKAISYFVIGRWSYENFGTISNLLKYNVLEFTEGSFEFTSKHVYNNWTIILCMAVLFLLFSILIIKESILSKKGNTLVLDDEHGKIKRRKHA